jgi:hypothetical protein
MTSSLRAPRTRPSKPVYVVIQDTRESDGVTVIERASFAYSKPKLRFVNGTWLTWKNETGGTTSAPVRWIDSVYRLEGGGDRG